MAKSAVAAVDWASEEGGGDGAAAAATEEGIEGIWERETSEIGATFCGEGFGGDAGLCFFFFTIRR
ncbi:predicted protein [Arabidopsis lyrata subsp. lyrata]|uniref:Predicted protein n=1 Tax=Arabidopsis lyrata subsp. lyrata TaxID=81972 RepID=D7MXD1_ARALL|nr:predicted protein [Arabidopsis lyrata subsp. lyrata]